MTPENKQKIKNAFNNAVNASPYADEIIDGIRTMDGRPMSRRHLVTAMVDDDAFYAQVDNLLTNTGITVDDFIGRFETGMKKSNKGPRP